MKWSCLCRPTAPTVRCSPGQLVVRFPVRQGVDLYTLMNEIASAFTSKCTSSKEGDSNVLSKVMPAHKPGTRLVIIYCWFHVR